MCAAKKISVIKYQCCFYCYNHVADRDRHDGVNRNVSYREERRDIFRGKNWTDSMILEEEGQTDKDRER